MEIFLRGDTTNVKIHKQGLGSLTHAVIQVEKILKNKVQDASSPLGPRDLAIKVRDALRDLSNLSQSKRSVVRALYLIPNPVYDIDPLTQQTPGVRVTTDEQKLTDTGDLVYTFQLEFTIKNSSSESATFQQFTDIVLKLDKSTRFLPWNTVEGSALP